MGRGSRSPKSAAVSEHRISCRKTPPRRSRLGSSIYYRRLDFQLLEDRCLLSVDLIRNGGFGGVVSPTDWAPTSSFHADSRFSNYHNSPGYAYLSNADGSAGNNLIGEMSQQFTIPSNATSTILTYWYSITTQDTSSTAHDYLNVTVRNSSGVYLASPGFYSNLNHTTGYQEATYDLTAFRGQTVTLDFLGTTDSSYPTVFRIDDVSAIATTTPHISGINPPQPIVNPATVDQRPGHRLCFRFDSHTLCWRHAVSNSGGPHAVLQPNANQRSRRTHSGEN